MTCCNLLYICTLDCLSSIKLKRVGLSPLLIHYQSLRRSTIHFSHTRAEVTGLVGADVQHCMTDKSLSFCEYSPKITCDGIVGPVDSG